MERRLYIPDTQRWIQFFEHRLKSTPKTIVKGRPRSTMITIKPTQVHETASPKIEVTSQSKDVVERAKSAQDRSKSIKRRAGEKIVTTKKVRRTANNKKSSLQFKDTPAISKKDIFN